MDLAPGQRENTVLEWIEEAVQEGDRFLRSQYGYAEIDKCIQYIQGEQMTVNRPRDLSNFSSNRLGKVTTDIVAALTDIKPMFSFKTMNAAFDPQSVILNKLTQGWWLNNFIDLKLGGGIQLAIPAGCAYLHIVFNRDLQGGHGDIDVIPLDCRDVIPIRPTSSISIQDCAGVVLRSVQTVNYLRSKYPSMANRIRADNDVAFYQPRTSAFSRMMQAVMTPVQAALRPKTGGSGFKIPGKEIRTVYIKDDRVNDSSNVIQMGYGSDGRPYSWSYDVQPGDMLYPRGRVIVAGKDMVFYDGPNVYWHGQFPLVKLYTDMSFVYPNSFLSKSLLKDLLPHQDCINEIINGIMDAVNQWLKRGVIADSRAVPKSLLEKLNTRKPGFKMLTNPTAGQGVQWQDGPQLPAFVFNFFQQMIQEIEYLSGSVDLSNLAKVKQIPAVESIEAIMQAMTPATRMRGRLMEAALRELAELVKFNFFQFYDARRRVAMLGEDGVTLEDFDFDPGTLIPDSDSPEFYGMPKMQRAIKHAHNFTFYVTPNSMLEIALVTKKMLYMQLRRGGELDWQTFMEAMEVPNLPQVQDRLGSEIDQKIAMLQQMEGGQAGRKPTAQTGPHMEVKEGGRPTVAES